MEMRIEMLEMHVKELERITAKQTELIDALIEEHNKKPLARQIARTAEFLKE